jgi:hypothetical protein
VLHPEQHIRGQPSEREYRNLSDEKAEQGNRDGDTGCGRLLEEPNATSESAPTDEGLDVREHRSHLV